MRFITLVSFEIGSDLHRGFILGSSRGWNRHLEPKLGLETAITTILRPQSRLWWPLQQRGADGSSGPGLTGLQGLSSGTESAWPP